MVDSDAAYLVIPKGKSRIAGYSHLSEHPKLLKHPMLNAAILVECKMIKHVVSSAAEAKVACLFHNTGKALEIKQILTELGHPQPHTPIKRDNTIAATFVYDDVHQKRSKTWDMRYYWLQDYMNQLQLNIFGGVVR